MSTECIPLTGEVSNRVQRNCMGSLSPAGHRSTWESTATMCQIHHLGLQVQITKLCHQNACWTQLFTSAGKKETLCLVFLFKVVKGSVPAIPPDDYLIPQRPKRVVHVRTFKDHITSNIVDSQVNMQQKQMFSGTSIEEPYRHSFFARTNIWNHLEDECSLDA